MSQAEPSVTDVTDASFEHEVIERSKQAPVVVDFWAPWCGPCRTLGPILERLATESAGGFFLAKVNIDENPRIAQAFGIQSIPFVIGFRDGEPVSEFVGAQPERVVRQFLERLLPSEADNLVEAARDLAAQGDFATAETQLRSALEKSPGHPRATLELAKILAADGRESEAASLLADVSASGELAQEIERVAAELRFKLAPQSSTDEATLRARLEADPGDLAARLELGKLLAASGRHEEAFEALLEVVRRDPQYEDAAARKAMLDLFTLLGREHPLADRYQRELARVLYR